MPDTSAESGNVDHFWLVCIWYHAVSPFEVESGDKCPVFASIAGPPSRGLKSGGIKGVGIFWVNRYVVNVLIPIDYSLPRLTRIN